MKIPFLPQPPNFWDDESQFSKEVPSRKPYFPFNGKYVKICGVRFYFKRVESGGSYDQWTGSSWVEVSGSYVQWTGICWEATLGSQGGLFGEVRLALYDSLCYSYRASWQRREKQLFKADTRRILLKHMPWWFVRLWLTLSDALVCYEYEIDSRSSKYF